MIVRRLDVVAIVAVTALASAPLILMGVAMGWAKWHDSLLPVAGQSCERDAVAYVEGREQWTNCEPPGARAATFVRPKCAIVGGKSGVNKC